VKKKDEAKKEVKKAEQPKKEESKVEEPKKEAIDYALKMREASEKLRRAMEKASEDYRRAMDKAHEDFRNEIDKFRAEGMPLRRPTPPFEPMRVRPRPGRLGMVVSPVAPFVAEQLGLEKDQGLMIAKVLPDGPAAKAGLRENDILLKLDGKPVTSRILDLEHIISNIKPKTPIDAEVQRKGKRETIKGIELSEMPPRAGAR
jgi:C-terminal processing protease CtpA/Prc